MQFNNNRLSDEEFYRERQEVLSEWSTGKEVDFDEAIEYHKNQPEEKNNVMVLAKAKQEGRVLLHGSGGADTLDRHIELVQHLQDEGQADVVSTWVDALTRNHRYAEADKGVTRAENSNKVVLNGFPIVHYGVTGTRRMTESIHIPACVVANGPDMRLITEIALAGGHTATNIGGSLCAFWGYTSDIPPETVMRYYQYLYRLLECYQERGVPILAGLIGTVAGASGTTPPSLELAPTIIEAILAAGQGVKHLRLVNRNFGNLAQDVASAILLRKLAQEYLERLGYHDVNICIGSYPPYGKFPEDDAQAFVIIGWAPLVAVFAGCEVINFFTVDEGRQIPRKEPNAATHRYVRMLLNILKDQEIDFLDNKAVKLEAEITERETKAILDKVLEMGNGDIVIGSGRAVAAGVLDQPFGTSRRILSRVLGVRDANGAVRYLEHGNLPFSKDIIDFHKEKIAERASKEGRKISYVAVIGDIYAFNRGELMSTTPPSG